MVSDKLPFGAYDELAADIWKLGKLIVPHLLTGVMAPSTITSGLYRPYAFRLDEYKIAELDFDMPEADEFEFSRLDELAQAEPDEEPDDGAEIEAEEESDDSEDGGEDNGEFEPANEFADELGALAVNLSVQFKLNEQRVPEPTVYTATTYEIERYEWRPPTAETDPATHILWAGSELMVWRRFRLQAAKAAAKRKILFSRGVTIATAMGEMEIRTPSRVRGQANDPACKAARDVARRPMRDDYDLFVQQLNMLAYTATYGD